jgi:hypothetical protein
MEENTNRETDRETINPTATLYAEPDSGSRSGTGDNRQTNTRTRKPRADAGTRKPRATARPRKRGTSMVASEEQIGALAASLSITARTAFRVPAYLRSSQWGMIQNPDGSTAYAGDFWLITEEEANQLGDAWARVIVLYAPEEAIAGTSVIAAAVLVTAGSLIPRVITDVEQKAAYTAMNAARETENQRANETAYSGFAPTDERAAAD